MNGRREGSRQMKIPQCQLPGYIFMFETPLEVEAQLLRHYPHRSEIFHAGR
jgi:hypothetical protein